MWILEALILLSADLGDFPESLYVNMNGENWLERIWQNCSRVKIKPFQKPADFTNIIKWKLEKKIMKMVGNVFTSSYEAFFMS